MNLRIGMLWFDDTPQRPLDDKIELAVRHYQVKYGSSPNICYVHPSVLAGGRSAGSSLQVVAAEFILQHHFWIGVAEPEGSHQTTVAAHLLVPPVILQ
jgi:hypothetical protein